VKAVNLIPAEQRAGGAPVAGESQGAAFIVLGLFAGLAVLALLYGMASHQISSRKGEVAKINTQAQVTQTRATELSPYTTFKAMYEQRQTAVNELVNTRFDWAHALHELGRVMPVDASLNSVKATVGAAVAAAGAPTSTGKSTGSAVASATPPGSVPTFVLAGCSTSQTETAQTLLRLRLIDGVSSVTLQSSTKGSSGAASSGGGSSGSGTCPSGDPAFAITVTFAALPTPPPAAGSALPGASAQNTADSGGSTASSSTASSSTSSASSSASGTKAPQ
jgi:Tfp pilus assembly protein PilN